jgi:hypothetical protein
LKQLKKNEKDCKETLKRFYFKKPRRKACPSEQVNPISIFDCEEKKHKDDLQQEQEVPLH